MMYRVRFFCAALAIAGWYGQGLPVPTLYTLNKCRCAAYLDMCIALSFSAILRLNIGNGWTTQSRDRMGHSRTIILFQRVIISSKLHCVSSLHFSLYIYYILYVLFKWYTSVRERRNAILPRWHVTIPTERIFTFRTRPKRVKERKKSSAKQ